MKLFRRGMLAALTAICCVGTVGTGESEAAKLKSPKKFNSGFVSTAVNSDSSHYRIEISQEWRGKKSRSFVVGSTSDSFMQFDRAGKRKTDRVSHKFAKLGKVKVRINTFLGQERTKLVFPSPNCKKKRQKLNAWVQFGHAKGKLNLSSAGKHIYFRRSVKNRPAIRVLFNLPKCAMKATQTDLSPEAESGMVLRGVDQSAKHYKVLQFRKTGQEPKATEGIFYETRKYGSTNMARYREGSGIKMTHKTKFEEVVAINSHIEGFGTGSPSFTRTDTGIRRYLNYKVYAPGSLDKFFTPKTVITMFDASAPVPANTQSASRTPARLRSFRPPRSPAGFRN